MSNNTKYQQGHIVLILFVAVSIVLVGLGFIYLKWYLHYPKSDLSTISSSTNGLTSIRKEGKNKNEAEKDFDRYKIVVPPNSFRGKTRIESSLESPPSGSPKFMHPWEAISIELIEWMKPTNYPYELFTIEKPIEVYVRYEITKHLKEDGITFYFVDKETGKWNPLETEINSKEKIAMTKVYNLGTYVLSVPYICKNDPYEAYLNDNPHLRLPAIIHPAGEEIKNPLFNQELSLSFDVKGDEDWFSFPATSSKKYTFEIINRARGVDVEISVYDDENFDTPLSSSLSNLTWIPSAELFDRSEGSLPFYVQIKPTKTSIIGCGATYRFVAREL